MYICRQIVHPVVSTTVTEQVHTWNPLAEKVSREWEQASLVPRLHPARVSLAV